MASDRRRGHRARRERGKFAETIDGRQAVLADRLQQTHHFDDFIVDASVFCKGLISVGASPFFSELTLALKLTDAATKIMIFQLLLVTCVEKV